MLKALQDLGSEHVTAEKQRAARKQIGDAWEAVRPGRRRSEVNSIDLHGTRLFEACLEIVHSTTRTTSGGTYRSAGRVSPG
jgi:hypothetical protein